MTRYPQTVVNLKVTKEGKLAFFTDSEINAKIDEVKEALGKSGRILVRPSGTEPLIRIMVEGMDVSQIERLANEVAETITNRLAGK